MGRSRVVESDGYTEENSARTVSGGRIRDPGLFQAISWDDWFYKEPLCVAGIFLFLNPERLVSPSEPFLGENSGLSPGTSLSGVFSKC